MTQVGGPEGRKGRCGEEVKSTEIESSRGLDSEVD